MGQDNSIASLRSRVSALVEQEGVLLSQAFELSRSGDRSAVDALFARVQAIQVERGSLTRQIGNLLGTQRMHVASEVWKLGIYEYRQEVGGDGVRIRIIDGPLGLQALLPGREQAVGIETLGGTFDGPIAVDDASAHRPAAGAKPVTRAKARGGRPAKKTQT